MREPLKVGQGAPPRGAAACVSQSWTVSLETTIAEGVGDSGRTKQGKGVSREQETGTPGDAEKLRPEVPRELRLLEGNGVSREQKTVPREQGTGGEDLRSLSELEGEPLGDEKRDKRLARWESRLGRALSVGSLTGAGIGGSLGDEKRERRSARRAEEDWSQ